MAGIKKKPQSEVASIRHTDKRTNIPTEELRDFVAEEEKAPKTMRYPRDPSLDPQLVWTGKDEQDAQDLAVPVVPVYIQEKIHPHAIIQDFKDRAAKPEAAERSTLNLFADFNGIDFEQQLDFYNHEQNWANRMILGDSLLVMTSLAEKEGLRGKVQMIYMDPPYGIRFGSNWQISTRKRDVKDGKAEEITRQPEQIQAFRDTWQLGIHSYLAYMRDRLTVARELLTDTGSVFVQIGDENVHLVRCVMDEVFGSENFCGLITFKKTTGAGSFSGGTNLLASTNDYLIWFAKNAEPSKAKYRQLYKEKEIGGAGGASYQWVQFAEGTRRTAADGEQASSLTSGARLFSCDNLTSQTVRTAQTTVFDVHLTGKTYRPAAGGWKTNKIGMTRLLFARRTIGLGNTLRYVRFFDDFPLFAISNFWDDTVAGFGEEKTYVVQTRSKVIARCLLMTTDPGDLVLDPTCGSGTTAYVAEQWGRRWITIDTSRVALALARTRLMSAKFPYYTLADSREGVLKEAELTGTVPAADFPTPGLDVKKGFVYKRVPHVTLKSIANNERIDEIHDSWEKRLSPVLAELNGLLKKSWEEWEVPRESDDAWSEKAEKLHASWLQMRRERQKDMDAAIAAGADPEYLYDQPYLDAKKLRVTGPFTVESLSPHRTISTSEDIPASQREVHDEPARQFARLIIDNLKKAGVQNTKKPERLRFETLDEYPGFWIHAAGTYVERSSQGPDAATTDEDGGQIVRRVAVSIGPEHGTVSPDMVKEAAKEAVQGIGFDLLVVCVFAFDPHVSEEVKRYGKLTVLPTRMNPDLAMGDELLKKTGSGNLFMVFGEPDIEVRTARPEDYEPGSGPKKGRKKTQAPDELVVELKGVDVYDPTTGEIRSSSTDDVMCWFIDVNYNGEAFFVRHAYFTGADRPYEKLTKALKAEINEIAWGALYRTVSRPFPRPETGKIAVKVINHYGDEALRVYEMKG